MELRGRLVQPEKFEDAQGFYTTIVAQNVKAATRQSLTTIQPLQRTSQRLLKAGSTLSMV